MVVPAITLEINTYLSIRTKHLAPAILKPKVDVIAAAFAFNVKLTWPRGYKTFFKLSSAEHEISTAHKF